MKPSLFDLLSITDLKQDVVVTVMTEPGRIINTGTVKDFISKNETATLKGYTVVKQQYLFEKLYIDVS